MDDDSRRKILDEARATLAVKDSFTQPALPSTDPLTRWREKAAQFEAEAKQGQQELREEERRRAETPAAWDTWFVAQLRRHLQSHLDPSFEGIAQGVGELVAELRHRAHAQDKTIAEQNKTIQALQLECARLAIKIAELRTDQVLNAMPTSSTMRGTVN